MIGISIKLPKLTEEERAAFIKAWEEESPTDMLIKELSKDPPEGLLADYPDEGGFAIPEGFTAEFTREIQNPTPEPLWRRVFHRLHLPGGRKTAKPGIVKTVKEKHHD